MNLKVTRPPGCHAEAVAYTGPADETRLPRTAVALICGSDNTAQFATGLPALRETDNGPLNTPDNMTVVEQATRLAREIIGAFCQGCAHNTSPVPETFGEAGQPYRPPARPRPVS